MGRVRADDKFALLRGKSKDIIFHGEYSHCYFDEELIGLLKSDRKTVKLFRI